MRQEPDTALLYVSGFSFAIMQDGALYFSVWQEALRMTVGCCGNEYLCTFSGDCFLQNKKPKQKRVRLSYTLMYPGLKP